MCYFGHIYCTNFALKVLMSGRCHELSLPTLKVDWLKIVLPLVSNSWQYKQKAARQVFKNLLAILFFLSQEIGFMKQLQLWPWFFLSSCPSQHHLCANPIISGLIAKCLRRPFCSTFWLRSVLSACFITSWSGCCGMMGPILVFASHHCPSAPQSQYTLHARAPLLRLPLTVWPHSELTWLMGFHPCSAPSEASLSPLSPCLGSLLRACHGRVTLLDDRTSRFQAVMSQTQWLMSTKHIKIELSLFTDGFHFVAMPSRESRAAPKASLVVSCWGCVLKF